MTHILTQRSYMPDLTYVSVPLLQHNMGQIICVISVSVCLSALSRSQFLTNLTQATGT